MFEEQNSPIGEDYRAGYNPKFVRRVIAKRRRAQEADQRERKRIADELEAKVAAARQAEIERAQHEVDRISAQKSAAISAVASTESPPMLAKRTPVREIIADTAGMFDLSVSDILGRSRERSLVYARHMAMWRVRKARPDLSYPQIAKAFGGRDHTTVIHAVRRMEAISAQEVR